MDGETILDELESNTATFIATMCYRDMADMETDLLNHDGNIVFARKHKSNGKPPLWRALHECMVEPGTEVLIVSPNQSGARGAILLLEDEMERALFDGDVWGVKQSTQTGIEFDNGSRIISHHIGDGNGGKRISGYTPDLLIVNNWEEEGYAISDAVIEDVLLPMIPTGNANLWVNDVTVDPDDPLVEYIINHGGYIKQLG